MGLTTPGPLLPQVRVSGHDCVGYGEAVSKVASQDLAAARFVKHLLDTGAVSAAELPAPLDSVNLNAPPENSVSLQREK